jgi:hypothetical protein
MVSILWVFNWSFHIVKYLCKVVTVGKRSRTPGLRRAVLSSYKARCVGRTRHVERYRENSVVESTAPRCRQATDWNRRKIRLQLQTRPVQSK